MIRKTEALEYHRRGRPGKLEVVPSKPCVTQRDLSLAYTPGVALPCLEIERDPGEAYRYTGRGNLVAVVSNGTAVLGLGDIGPLASKPVMEGKGVLFKRFADVDVFDIEIDSRDPEEIIRTVELLAPTVGGVNLEDIKAPECFHIESELARRLDIPVFHDDQHGTAIISGAALLNALELVDKRIEEIRVVFSGAGAAGIACADYYVSLGVRPENLLLCDSRGVLTKRREAELNPFKKRFVRDTDRVTLADALVDADVFVGLSGPNVLGPDEVRSMAPRPILFAMANPTPEIGYEEAVAARPDVVMATGRSDYPNQVNNVLGFPFIFRGALDVRATAINEEMKLAATRALAELARQDVPDSVLKAYGLDRLRFGAEYLIPKPFDRRVLLDVASAVARAAMETGVAQRELDLDEYRDALERRFGKSSEVMRLMINQAKTAPKRVVLADGENPKVLRAAQTLVDESIAEPILLGDRDRILALLAELELHVPGARVVDPRTSELRTGYVDRLYRSRRRKGLTEADTEKLLDQPMWFGSLMVAAGDADALVGGIDQHFPEALRPVLKAIGAQGERAHGLFLIFANNRLYFFADPTVNIDPTAEELAEIAISSADEARRFHVEPRIAMLSFGNFGSVRHPATEKVRRATEIVKARRPDLQIDGEMQAKTAMDPALVRDVFPFCELTGEANVLIFPDLASANVAYQLVQHLGGGEAVGPILTGMRRPVHVLQHGCDSEDVVRLATIAVVDAQDAQRNTLPEPDPAPALTGATT